jgi:hypothetical protein
MRVLAVELQAVGRTRRRALPRSQIAKAICRSSPDRHKEPVSRAQLLRFRQIALDELVPAHCER